MRGPRSVDRVVALVATTLMAAGLLTTAAIAHAPIPPVPRNDPHAMADLIALLRRGEHATYLIQETFARHTNRGGFSVDISEARTTGLLVRRSGDTLHLETARSQYDCSLLSGKPDCQGGGPMPLALPPSETIGVVTALGGYDVTRIGSSRIAGERVLCFRLTHAAGNPLPELGEQTDQCLTGDGVPLGVRTSGPLGVDDWVVTSLSRRVDRSDLAPLLHGFESVVPTASG
ncbi:MAG TPA: hypothetical protein VFR41_13240 [Acidimicrobiia bacterium]|nr:hypothetical protein [Acidimicrobiia bacterium]